MEKKNNLRIIIIDDNPSIHQDFMKILITDKNRIANANMSDMEKELFGFELANSSESHLLPNFEIDTASQGQEGVEKIREAIKNGKPYALAFVDVRMPPGWDGVETIKHIWEIDKDIQVVICTAYSDYTWEETIEKLGEHDNLLILKKPFDNIAVRQLASALTKKWQLMDEAKKYTSSLESRVLLRTESLKKSLSLMRATLESSADGILVVNNKNEISDFNNKFLEIWQMDKTELNQKTFMEVTEYMLGFIENSEDISAQFKKIAEQTDEILIGKIKLKNKTIIEYYTQPYILNEKSIGRVWSFRDVTQRATLEEKLQHQATHDLLTDLPNRILMLDKIKESITQAKKNKKTFAVLFLDLDHFKLINDSLSHQAGDAILRQVAKRLGSLIKPDDCLARLGGDEFVIIINNVDDNQSIIDFCKKVLNIFKNPFQIQDQTLTLSTSIGVCVYSKMAETIDGLLRGADIAMYEAKGLGANQFQFYTESLSNKIELRLQQESDLRRAIENDEFELYYQPQLDLRTNKLVSVEALIRWHHPTKGLIMPIDFIPIAEETGLIVPIGEWVIKTACKQIKAWQNKGLPEIRVAVNITTKQFRLYNLVQNIKNILAEVQLEPRYLELELTENMIINNVDMVKTIYDLKAMGVQIALDDFGTGYSSLNYLREIPVDRLKIDQSYVQNIDSNRGDDVLIQAIISMAKSLNLEVLAEGVETKRQIDFLRKKQCSEIQGFYFSKPISVEECELFLKEPHKLTELVPAKS